MRQKGCKEAAEWPGGGTPYIRMIGMILVYFRGYSSKFLWRISWYLLGYKNRYFEYASSINSGLLVFFRLIFDQEVYFRVCKFYGLVFFWVVF